MRAGLWLLSGLLATTTAAGHQEEPTPDVRTIERGTHSRMLFDQPVKRVAIGDPTLVEHHLLGDREVLLLGVGDGRTSVTLWFADDTVRVLQVRVSPDLSVLQGALREIHPSLNAELAPDRNALVLRGRVPDLAVSRAAETAAQAYLAGDTRQDRVAEPPVVADGAIGVSVDDDRQSQGSVINLIQLDKLPPSIDVRMLEAAQRVGATELQVHRVSAGLLPNDAVDTFVLTGEVETQAMLTRILHLAMVTLGEDSTGEIEVVADESGALTKIQNNLGGGQGVQQGFQGGNNSLFGGGQSQQQRLGNRIGQNLGRATVLQAANGRLLSFIHVRDLPQVRVLVELYEIDRTRLDEFEGGFAVIASDFDQPSLQPAGGATAVQGEQARRVGSVSDSDIQDVVGFLENGLSNQLQISGSRIALDAVLRVLESRGIARSLSRPTLTVLSGEQALFQVGGEIPIPTSFAPTFGGADDGQPAGVFNSVTFRPFGVQLSVRPLVDHDDYVTLDVVPQIITPDFELTTLVRDATGTDPLTAGFRSRSLSTSARLQDGQILLLGGLASELVSSSESYAPWLREIPILGRLFERRDGQDETSELLVVVDPAILRGPIPERHLWCFPTGMELLRSTRRAPSDASESDPDEEPPATTRSTVSRFP